MKSLTTVSLAALMALGLSACGSDQSSPEATQPAQAPAKAAQSESPTAVIDGVARELANGNLLAVMQLSMPAAKFDEAKSKWIEERDQDPPSEEEKAKFAEMMTKLTADDGEEQMMAELEPHLVKYDTEMAPQKPMMVGMGQGFAAQAIQENQELSADEKQAATNALGGAANWINATNFGDRELARKAVREAITTAKALDMTSLDEVQSMDFETMLGKAGTAFQGVKRVFAVYGLDLNKTLQSVKSELVSQDGDKATVKVNFNLFDQPLSFNTEMVQVDGRWYGKKAMEQVSETADEAEDMIEDTENAEDTADLNH
ncbi:MAG: hypothetical protein KDI75_11345 [Xanthomonadales bacterium]|nr:hypothetical protein [Xanthomonadales bacterium]